MSAEFAVEQVGCACTFPTFLTGGVLLGGSQFKVGGDVIITGDLGRGGVDARFIDDSYGTFIDPSMAGVVENNTDISGVILNDKGELELQAIASGVGTPSSGEISSIVLECILSF